MIRLKWHIHDVLKTRKSHINIINGLLYTVVLDHHRNILITIIVKLRLSSLHCAICIFSYVSKTSCTRNMQNTSRTLNTIHCVTTRQWRTRTLLSCGRPFFVRSNSRYVCPDSWEQCTDTHIGNCLKDIYNLDWRRIIDNICILRRIQRIISSRL